MGSGEQELLVYHALVPRTLNSGDLVSALRMSRISSDPRTEISTSFSGTGGHVLSGVSPETDHIYRRFYEVTHVLALEWTQTARAKDVMRQTIGLEIRRRHTFAVIVDGPV